MDREFPKRDPDQARLLKFSDSQGREVCLTINEFQSAFRIYRIMAEESENVDDAVLVSKLAVEFTRMSPKEIGTLAALVKKTR